MDRLAGFLIVKAFPRLYRDYVGRYHLDRDVYAIPRSDRAPETYAIQYRGLDRDPLSALRPYIERNLIKEDATYMLAEVRIAELEAVGSADRFCIANDEDARDVHAWVDENAQTDYEIVWARVARSARRPPEGFRSVGYEPSYFPDGYFSASCDAMMIPRWHGTDEGGQLFLPFFQRVNRHGLFATAADAEEFLRYYCSFEWTERGAYNTVEIFLREAPE